MPRHGAARTRRLIPFPAWGNTAPAHNAGMTPSDDTPSPLDEQQAREWQDAFAALAQTEGPDAARALLDSLAELSMRLQLGWKPPRNTPYINTIAAERQAAFPGDLATEERLCALMRWNALAMVVRANQAYGELGGHISSYASAADLFEVGFNHFFRARTNEFGGDLVFFQPHSAPGVYARAFLEGRLSEESLAMYRQEITATRQGVQGLSSYCHPWLMPGFWQFPTGSMGLGPISAIYQARLLRYLDHRSLVPTQGRRVWGVFGDGEMDEPESMSALTLAAREKLDNLTFVVNCNLQRLDGPVRGNGRIIDELEALFAGAGWNVIKLIWGSDWDGLLARDRTGALVRALGNTVDGQYQTFAAKDGRFNRERFFGQHPDLQALAQGLTDEQIDRLRRGGHDLVKIHAAYHAAVRHPGRPTVILAHTKKGYGMGPAGQGRMTTHQQKKLERGDLLAIRDRAQLPLSDEQAEHLAFIKPPADSPEMQYMHARRAALGGYLPLRSAVAPQLAVPGVDGWGRFALQADGKEMSTTMALVRMFGTLMKDAGIGRRIVPIVADEARTFGMASLFNQFGIYASAGQLYEPEDFGSLMSYRESVDGQILEEGISEAGALASWTAAATSYSVNGLALLPFYIYYSMFGFQRVGDAIWAAADQRARGFLIGATAGRTTLGGEGLQHQDGQSHLMAATVPNCRAWDPATAGELALIIEHGMRSMLEEQRDEFFYITVGNASYAQPSLPEAAAAQVLRGMYLARSSVVDGPQVQLLVSGAIYTEALAAAEALEAQGVRAQLWSVTSWSELARDGATCEREARLGGQASVPFIAAQLREHAGPIIAASDYVRAVPEQVRAHLPEGRSYTVLGTDGFGRSDTRAVLREFFEVDAASIVRAALHSLGRPVTTPADAGPPPWTK
jgi:pyruvate dehydrogenase E1 component